MNLLLVVLALLLMVLLFAAVRAQRHPITSLEELQARWKAVDLPALLNLVDRQEERYLRQNLSPLDFNLIHRKRLMVVWEYLSRVSSNAQLMVQSGQIIQQSSDGERAADALTLVADAVRLRNMVFMAKFSTAMKFVFPGKTSPIAEVLEAYARSRRNLEEAFSEHKIHAVTRMA